MICKSKEQQNKRYRNLYFVNEIKSTKNSLLVNRLKHRLDDLCSDVSTGGFLYQSVKASKNEQLINEHKLYVCVHCRVYVRWLGVCFFRHNKN